MKKLIAIAVACSWVVACVEAPPVIDINPDPDPGEEEVDGNNDGVPDPDGIDGIDKPVEDPVDEGIPEIETAHGMYIEKVHPSLMATCQNCHVADNGVSVGPQWLDGAPELSYTLTKGFKDGIFLTADPANSLLVNKGPHSGGGAPALTSEQVTIVSEWLAQEQLENPKMDPDPPKGASLDTWLGCFAGAMDITRFETTGMDLFALQQVNGGGNCAGCHNQGLGNTYLNAEAQLTFDNLQKYPYILRLVKPVYQDGIIMGLALETRMIEKGDEECAAPPNCHPNFLITAARVQALEDFVSQTIAAMDLAACNIPAP